MPPVDTETTAPPTEEVIATAVQPEEAPDAPAPANGTDHESLVDQATVRSVADLAAVVRRLAKRVEANELYVAWQGGGATLAAIKANPKEYRKS